MSAKILIVEDEILVAVDLEAMIEDCGHTAIGVAPDTDTALRLASAKPDVAFVDIHLRDGRTGLDIGTRLARDYGVAVIFLTANPRLVTQAVPGVLGVIEKPCAERTIGPAVAYALGRRRGQLVPPPSELTLISADLASQ